MDSFRWDILFNPFQVNMYISRIMRQILHNVQEGKRHQKKRDKSNF
jgi:hypothetical protein